MHKQQIIDEIRRTADANGGVPLGRQTFFEATGIKETDWSGKYWARWSDAISDAGFEAQKMQAAYSDEFVLSSYAYIFRKLGRPPTTPELKLASRNSSDFPSHNTFGRYGSKQHLINKLHAFCTDHEEFADVASLCAPFVKDVPDESEDDGSKVAEQEGHVYMIKSGRFYKIGRTNSLSRRERELSIQLPQTSETIHSIATDDASGIEAYWHRRFTAKRKNGEWFELSNADVRAFKRRKFM